MLSLKLRMKYTYDNSRYSKINNKKHFLMKIQTNMVNSIIELHNLYTSKTALVLNSVLYE